jgi:hypothetical protein
MADAFNRLLDETGSRHGPAPPARHAVSARNAPRPAQ